MKIHSVLLPLFLATAVLFVTSTPCIPQTQPAAESDASSPVSLSVQVPFSATPGDTFALEGYVNSRRPLILSIKGTPPQGVAPLKFSSLSSDTAVRFVVDTLAPAAPGSERDESIYPDRDKTPLEAVSATDIRIRARGIIAPGAKIGLHDFTLAVDYQYFAAPDSGVSRIPPPERQTAQAAIYVDSTAAHGLDVQRQIIETHVAARCSLHEATSKPLIALVLLPAGVRLSPEFLHRWQHVTIVEAPNGQRPDSIQVGRNAGSEVRTVQLSYDRFRWAGPNEVLFEAGDVVAPLAGSGALYRAVCSGNTWTITHLRNIWRS